MPTPNGEGGLQSAPGPRSVAPFRDRRLTAGCLLIWLQFFAAQGFFPLGPQYLQSVLDNGPLQVALPLLPLGVGIVPTVPLAPRLVSRWGVHVVGPAGPLILAASLIAPDRVDASQDAPAQASDAANSGVATAVALAQGLGPPRIPLVQAARDAFTDGYQLALWSGAAGSVVGALACIAPRAALPGSCPSCSPLTTISGRTPLNSSGESDAVVGDGWTRVRRNGRRLRVRMTHTQKRLNLRPAVGKKPFSSLNHRSRSFAGPAEPTGAPT